MERRKAGTGTAGVDESRKVLCDDGLTVESIVLYLENVVGHTAPWFADQSEVLHPDGPGAEGEGSPDPPQVSQRNVHHKEWSQDPGDIQRQPPSVGYRHLQCQGAEEGEWRGIQEDVPGGGEDVGAAELSGDDPAGAGVSGPERSAVPVRDLSREGDCQL